MKAMIQDQRRAALLLPAAAASAPTTLPARWAAANAADDLSPLWRLLVDRGSKERISRGASALDHALCCAQLAQEAGAEAELVTASLLHDVGHLLREDFCVGHTPAARDRHAMIGAAFLSLWFGPEVTELVRLHAEAKRYLCAVEPGYADRLTRQARRSLEGNGGPMSRDEFQAFASGPHSRRVVLLRRWDDRAAAEPRALAQSASTLARFQNVAQRCLVRRAAA